MQINSTISPSLSSLETRKLRCAAEKNGHDWHAICQGFVAGILPYSSIRSRFRASRANW